MKLLLKQINAVLPENETLVVRRCDICVDGIRFVHVGDCPPDFKPDRTIDGQNKLLMPGLINAHTHAAMTLLRNRADDLPFMTWLFNHIIPMEDKLVPGDCYWGSLLAHAEMLKSGTTCYADMYREFDDSVRAVDESGIRAQLSIGILNEEDLQLALAETKQHMGKHPRITFALAPHAPYTCTPNVTRKVVDHAHELDLPLHTHLGESRDEIAQIKAKYNMSPFELMEACGLFERPVLAAHCVYMTEQDMQIAAKHNMSVATNPVSNLKLANGVAPVKKMLAHGINVALGTDGAASNNSLNMIRELGFLCLLHKGVNEDAECIPAAQGIKIATENGAKALGLYGAVGSIEVGKAADFAMLNCESAHWMPQSNLLAALCYGAQGSDVCMTAVNGEILYENGQLTKIDEERVKYEAQKIAERVCT